MTDTIDAITQAWTPLRAVDPNAVVGDHPIGTLTALPQRVRFTAHGAAMILNNVIGICWQSPRGGTLVRGMQDAHAILREHGFAVAADPDEGGNYAVVPVPVEQYGPPIPEGLDIPVFLRRAAPAFAPEHVPDNLPPDLRALLLRCADALPASEPGDLIDTNRLLIAYTVWQAIVAHGYDAVGLLCAATTPDAAPPPAPSRKGRR